MPMNSNIPFQALATVPLQSPLNSMLRVQQLRRSQQEEQLNAMRMDKYRQDMADAPRLAAQQNAQEFLKESVPMLAKLPPEQRPGAFAQVLAYGQQSGESMDGIPQSYDQISRLVDAAAVPDPMTPYQSARLNQYDQGLEIQRYNATKPPQFQPQAPVMVVDPVTGKPTYAAPGDSYGRQAYVKPSTAKTPEQIAADEGAKITGRASAERRENLPKLKFTYERMEEQSKGIKATITEAKDMASNWNTTGWGALLAIMPQTEARKLQGHIKMIVSNIGLDRLAEMRAAAANGASGLGQLAVKELEALQANIATLDQLQGSDDVKAALDKVDASYTKAMERYKAFMIDEDRLLSNQLPDSALRAPGGAPPEGISAEEWAQATAEERALWAQ